MFLAVLFPLTCGGSVFAVVITSFITKTVPADDTGAALGKYPFHRITLFHTAVRKVGE